MWFAEHPASLATHLYFEIDSNDNHAFVPLTERTGINTELYVFLIEK